MKVKVLKSFLDINNLRHRFVVGEVVEFDKERATNAIAKGLVEEVKELAEKQTATPAPSAEPKEDQEEIVTEEPKAEQVTKKVTRKGKKYTK